MQKQTYEIRVDIDKPGTQKVDYKLHTDFGLCITSGGSKVKAYKLHTDFGLYIGQTHLTPHCQGTIEFNGFS